MTIQERLGSKLKVMRLANQELSLNSLGLPNGYYRADLLPDDSEVFVERSVSESTEYSAPEDTNDVRTSLNGIVQDVDAELAEPLELDDGQSDEDEVHDMLLGEQHKAEMADEADANKQNHIDAQAAREVMVPTVAEVLPSKWDMHLPPGALEAAYVPLDYLEAYPALPDGAPFWYQMAHEPEDAYIAFEVYLRQGLKGARQLFSLGDTAELKKRAEALGIQRLPQNVIQAWAQLYYWPHRAKAFDFYNTAAVRKSRETLAMVLENQHYLDSSRMYERLMIRMSSDEFWAQLSPKETLQALDMATKLQRISLGLAAGGPSGKDAEGTTRSHQSVTTLMSTVAKEQGNAESNEAGKGQAEKLRGLAAGDSKTIELLQEVVIRTTNRG